MTDLEFQEKFEELIGNEEFRSQLSGLKEREEIRELFLKNGLELTEEILDSAMSELKKIKETGEIDEKVLELVTGGWNWRGMFGGIFVGGASGAGMGFISGGPGGAIVGAVIGAVAGGAMGGAS